MRFIIKGASQAFLEQQIYKKFDKYKSMTARDALSLVKKTAANGSQSDAVPAGMHLLEVLPRLLESSSRELQVEDNEQVIGVIDPDSMLEALARQLPPRYDSSIIELSCHPADYSASRLAHAVEDTDAHLVDLISVPGDEDSIHITLRVRCEDPTAAIHSLERYGYEVTGVHAHDNLVPTATLERLLSLQALINV